ncbi:MAG TPA: AraC family transcriptional regulator [Terriglobales bacterium]|nr:AraC family transcriptional regulator [Terriglobales bacterium]
MVATVRDRVRFQNAGIDCTRALYTPASSTGRHYHDDSNVVLALSGSFTQTMCSRTTVVAPNGLMYVPEGEIHATDFGPNGACCFFVALNESWTRNRLEDSKIDARRPKIATGGYLQAFALKMYAEFKNPDSLSDLIVEGAVLELLGRWFRECSRSHQHAPAWLRSVKTLLRDSFRESIALSDLSQAVGVHPSHIAREFHRAYGLTIGECVRKLRVDFIAEKLRNCEKDGSSLTDLALEAGFSSHPHMSSVFKRLTGMTPSQYKKAHGITSIP